MTPLWLALDLPLLALEAHGALSPPSAVAEQGRVLACDTVAETAGIRIADGLATARALVPGVRIVPRDMARERAALEMLACWAGNFTPRMSLAPRGLLLEIGGCLRLFQGAQAIVEALRAGVREQGLTASLAVAPTARAALWFAETMVEAFCFEPGEMHAQLDALPVSVLPDQAAALLESFGIHTLGEVRHLPTVALGRRIGVETMTAVARAYGELPDPRPDFVFPRQFSHALELPAGVENAGALLFAARRLVAGLAGWLAQRQAGVRACTLHLLHRRGATAVSLRFTDPTRDEARLMRVLREHLERLRLGAPVETLRLDADEIADQPGESGVLFRDAGTTRGAMSQLLERLRARLGERQVQALALRADHRPECATLYRGEADCASATPSPAARAQPLWLLHHPVPLREVNGQPWRHGTLNLLAGPERIESGWWDQSEAAALGDVRRDYFIAAAPDGRRLWIYRDGHVPGWFLHGWFS